MATACFTKGLRVFLSVFTFLLHSAACVTVALIASSAVRGFGTKPLQAHCTCMLMHTHTYLQTHMETHSHICIDTNTYIHTHTHTGAGVCVVHRAC